jgi:hypothetical protein
MAHLPRWRASLEARRRPHGLPGRDPGQRGPDHRELVGVKETDDTGALGRLDSVLLDRVGDLLFPRPCRPGEVTDRQ